MMGRRRLVALVSALAMLAIGAGVVVGFAAATQSEGGRNLIRRVLEAQLERSLEGTVELGTLSGSFLTDLRTDSLVIRDRNDSVFVATGPIRVTFDPRDLVDGRIILRSAEITRPFLAMRRGFDTKWSHNRLWPERPGTRLRAPRSAFGSVIIIEDAQVTDGRFTLMMPWEPADSLRGARRDSAIAVALENPEQITRRADDGFIRTWNWTDIQLALPRVRLAYPDSAGRHFEIARMDVDESNPPFTFHDITGDVRWLGDSVWFDVSHFDLRASTGRGRGKIVWGSDLPVRYDAQVVGDSVSMADIAWIDDALPTTGGGSVVLRIANSVEDLEILEYELTSLDVRTHGSRLRGRMTWGIGGPVTLLKDVDLEASPLDFALLERFHQGPFPVAWKGRFTGRVRARGGPLNRFMVDDVTTVFRDANVPGAVTRGSASGQLDILRPSEAVFRGFTVRLQQLDLRTLQFLDSDFPRLDGTLAGTARVDSSWLDARFSEADVTHRDGDAPPSRLRGTGRLTWGADRVSYELDAAALPLSFTALAQSFPETPWRGEASGPLRVRGSLADLFVTADLVGEAGRVETDLRLDAERPVYRVTGRANLSAVDPRRALDNERAPDGELTARVAMDVMGDSLADLQGDATVIVDRSLLDGVRVFAGNARMRFGEGRAMLDTLHLETSALELSAGGALGLHAGRPDTLRVRASVDSLGGLRRWLARATNDSLAGRIGLEALAHGWLRDFAVGATANGSGLLWRGTTIEGVRGTAQLEDLPGTPVGVMALVADTVQSGGFGLSTINARATLDGSGGAEVSVAGTGARGTLLRSGARVARVDDSLLVRMDSLSVNTALSRWRLSSPTRLALGAFGFALDSLVMLADADASVRLSGAAPRTGPMGLRFAARALPLADVSELLQLDGASAGHADVDLVLEGTRHAPEVGGRAELRNALVSGIRLDTLRLTGRAVADQLQLSAILGPSDAPSLRAEGTLPLRVGFNGTRTTWLDGGPVRGSVHADSLSLGIFEALTDDVTGYPGRLALDVRLGGTWGRPTLDGELNVRDGVLALGPLGDVRWHDVGADVAFIGDSVAVREVSAMSSVDGRTGRARVSGWMSIADRENPLLDLRWNSREFHAFARPGVADVDISGELRLAGEWRDATLSGMLTADRAVVSIPELAGKDVISLEEFDRFGVVDTLVSLANRRLPTGPSTLVENLTIANVPITMGRDVWLRSTEANINLGGFVSITRGRVTRGRDAGQLQLALDGPLQTVRGTYRLNLGPVQRTFEVQDGEIRFFGDPDLNPTLDINAVHTVRQYSQQGARPDVRVRVHLGGTLTNPTAELSTPDSARVTNADLISYLVTGGPSYEIAGREGDYTSTAARVLLSSFGSVLGGKAAGGLCDDAQVSTAGLEGYGGGIRDVGGSILSGTRFSCAKQVGDRAFLRLDAGLCQVGQLMSAGGSTTALNLTDAIGVKLDYLLAPGLTASMGVEPPTNAVLCALNGSARGFVPTPQQIGFDLFRAWRF